MNKSRIISLCKNEQGSILVIVAAAMIMIIGMTALVIDVGITMREKQRLDNAVDAAVLAGIHYIQNQSDAFQKAADYLNSNLQVSLTGPVINGSKATYRDPVDATAVIEMEVSGNSFFVSYQKDSTLYFGRFFDQDFWEVRSRARALRAPVSQAKGIIPFGVQDAGYAYGQQYVIEGDTFNGSSYFGLLDLPYIDTNGIAGYESFNGCIGNYQNTGSKSLNEGQGNTINKYTVCGYPDMLAIGDKLDKKSGATLGQVTDYVQWRIDESNKVNGCKDGQFPGGVATCLRTVLLPKIKVIDNQKVEIVGFSSFWIDKIEGNGRNQKIYGKFINNVTISGDFDSGATDHGTYAVKLVE